MITLVSLAAHCISPSPPEYRRQERKIHQIIFEASSQHASNLLSNQSFIRLNVLSLLLPLPSRLLPGPSHLHNTNQELMKTLKSAIIYFTFQMWKWCPGTPTVDILNLLTAKNIFQSHSDYSGLGTNKFINYSNPIPWKDLKTRSYCKNSQLWIL